MYTWCALDTLMFPALTGKIARVTSRCAATGRPITLTVAPEAVLHVEPAEAMVSLRTPDTSPDIRCSFLLSCAFLCVSVYCKFVGLRPTKGLRSCLSRVRSTLVMMSRLSC